MNLWFAKNNIKKKKLKYETYIQTAWYADYCQGEAHGQEELGG
jgi:hypothetical protein